MLSRLPRLPLRLPSAGSLSPPVVGALWMTGAAFAFSAMVALVRVATEWLPPLQVVFLRSLFGILFMLPWLLSAGLTGLRTRRPGLHILRAVLGVGSMMCWFVGISMLPLSEAMTLSFTTPLFATIGAALVLGETVRGRRWAATAVGFVGVLIIVRPDSQGLSMAAVLVLTSAMLMACCVLVIKSLSRTESSNAIVTYMTLLMTPLALAPALFVWETPGLVVIAVMIAVAGLGTVGHQCLARAMKAADASVVMPFEYLKLPLAAAFGFFFFGEVTDWATWAGALVIVGSAVYIARREARAAARPAPAASKQPEATVR